MKNIVRLTLIIIGVSTSVYCCNLSDFEEIRGYNYSVKEPYSQVFSRIFKKELRIFECCLKDYLKKKHKYRFNKVKVCDEFEEEKEELRKSNAKDIFNVLCDSTVYLYYYGSKCIISPVIEEMYIWTNYVQIFGLYNEKEAHAFMREVIGIAKPFIFPKKYIKQKKNQNVIEAKTKDIANVVNFPK